MVSLPIITNVHLLQRFSRNSVSSLTRSTYWLQSNVSSMSKINTLQSDFSTMMNQTDFQDNSYAEHGEHNIGKRHSFAISGRLIFF